VGSAGREEGRPRKKIPRRLNVQNQGEGKKWSNKRRGLLIMRGKSSNHMEGEYRHGKGPRIFRNQESKRPSN